MKAVLIGDAEAPLEEVMEWLNSLWMEKYPKGRGALQTSKGFCCLGVGCQTSIPEAWREKDFCGRLLGVQAGNQKHAPGWLKEVDKIFYLETGQHLSGLNDAGPQTFKRRVTVWSGPEPLFVDIPGGEWTHPEIADLVYAVFVLRVLE